MAPSRDFQKGDIVKYVSRPGDYFKCPESYYGVVTAGTNTHGHEVTTVRWQALDQPGWHNTFSGEKADRLVLVSEEQHTLVLLAYPELADPPE